MSEYFGHANDAVRAALLEQVESLKKLIPDTEATRRNIAAIEKQRPPEKMKESMLRSYVDLLARSVQ